MANKWTGIVTITVFFENHGKQRTVLWLRGASQHKDLCADSCVSSSMQLPIWLLCPGLWPPQAACAVRLHAWSDPLGSQ